MCGRVACIYGRCELMQACGYKDKRNGKYKQADWRDNNNMNRQYKPSTNLAPTDVIPVIVSGNHFNTNSDRIIFPMIWGMIPHWHKGDYKAGKAHTHNCRKEGLTESKLFSVPFNSGRRCVIVCNGFYEWQTTKGAKNKQPYLIYNPELSEISFDTLLKCMNVDQWNEDEGWKGPSVIKFAGLFNKTPISQGEDIYSCSIITMESNDTLSWLHHRMPAILNNDDLVDNWLDFGRVPSTDALSHLNPVKTLSWHPVSSDVNYSKNKEMTLMRKINMEKPKNVSKSSQFMTAWLKKSSPQKRNSNDDDDISQQEGKKMKIDKK